MLTGKIAIVTGGGQGVGRGIALALAAQGADLVLAGRTRETLERTAGEVEARGRRAVPVVCDVGHRDQVDAMVDAAVAAFGGVDILVNNAQTVRTGRVLEITPEQVDLV